MKEFSGEMVLIKWCYDPQHQIRKPQIAEIKVIWPRSHG
jgi:hypothetical protein